MHAVCACYPALAHCLLVVLHVLTVLCCIAPLTQGLLAYYYRHAQPQLGFAADRCKYNYMLDSDECRRYLDSSTSSFKRAVAHAHVSRDNSRQS
jgi:hypothetical protein